MVLTFRCVLAAGDPTIVVVVADVIEAVLVRPGVIAPLRLSSHEACTSVLAADDVTTEMASDVDVSRIISGYFPERPHIAATDAKSSMLATALAMGNIHIRRRLFRPRLERLDVVVLGMAAARPE